MLAMAFWTLKPDKIEGEKNATQTSAFLATLISFFIAEIGDKTQIATMALAAGYSNLLAVVAGTTTGMMAANIPVVFLGNAFAARLPMQKIHYAASALFAVLGALFIGRAFVHWAGVV
jgi:putative Ca2+/H+ antiporter (TMEM165/GDT1 family)